MPNRKRRSHAVTGLHATKFRGGVGLPNVSNIRIVRTAQGQARMGRKSHHRGRMLLGSMGGSGAAGRWAL